MDTNELLSIIYQNYEPFLAMTTAVALVSSYNSPESDRDSLSIIRFIAEAYALPPEITACFANCILDRMTHIGLITDYHALCAGDLLDEQDRENLELYEIKGRVLEQVAAHEACSYPFGDMRMAHQIRLNMKYEYFHHPYNPVMRFHTLQNKADFGSILLTRQLALLYTLGIGCDADQEKAEKLFLRCVLWDDTVSARLLERHCSRWNVRHYQEGTFRELYGLMESARELAPPAPDSPEPQRFYYLQQMVKRYVTAPTRDFQINPQLADALLSDRLTYRQKLGLIVQFQDRRAKAIPPADSGRQTIGFRVSKHE